MALPLEASCTNCCWFPIKRQSVRCIGTVAEWNTLGLEQPAIAENAQQGIDLLGHNRYDADFFPLSVSEGKKFFSYLSRRPEMLGMETARDEERLRKEISAARRALSTRDASRQNKQVDDYTKALQGEFLRSVARRGI